VNEHTNENLPSSVKITLRDGRVTLKFRTATVITTPEGAVEIARALMEVADWKPDPTA
jgi:hypothetical protein